MKLIIDIPENFIKDDLTHFFGCYSTKLDEVIKNGKSLPKGHGNLFDENDFEKRVAIMTESMDLGYGEIMDIIDEIPTIIEADKAERSE